MSTETPPDAGTLNGSTSDIQGWTRDGSTELVASRKVFDRWLDSVQSAASLLQEQLNAAKGLVINEGAVGSFTSAKMTASNLNESADAIRERLTESIEFVNALREYSEAAYKRLFAQDSQ